MVKWKMILAYIITGAAFCLLLLMVVTFFLGDKFGGICICMCSLLLLCTAWLFFRDTAEWDLTVSDLKKKAEEQAAVCSHLEEKVDRITDKLNMLKDRIARVEEILGIDSEPDKELSENKRQEPIAGIQEEKRINRGSEKTSSSQMINKGSGIYKKENPAGLTRQQSIADSQKVPVKEKIYLPDEKKLTGSPQNKVKIPVKLEPVRADEGSPNVKKYNIYKDGKGKFSITGNGEIIPTFFQEGERLTKQVIDQIDAAEMRGLFNIPREVLTDRMVTEVIPAVITTNGWQGANQIQTKGIVKKMGEIKLK